MPQIKIYQFGPEDNYAYDIIDDEGNIVMTGDGFETYEEAYDWINELRSTLDSSVLLPKSEE